MSDTPRTDAAAFNQLWDSREMPPDETTVDVDFARQLERELQQSEAACASMREALQEHHNHATDTCVVFFEQDGQPIGISTDLGEAYSESLLCEKALKALSTTAGTELLKEVEGYKETISLQCQELEELRKDKERLGKVIRNGFSILTYRAPDLDGYEFEVGSNGIKHCCLRTAIDQAKENK